MMRSTHTFATLALSQGAYDEIRDALKAAGYEHAFMPDGAIDMHGIGVEPILTPDQRTAVTEVPTPQFIEQQEHDDCERACLAMLLGVRLEDVPHFCRQFNELRKTMKSWEATRIVDRAKRMWLRDNFGMDTLTHNWTKECAEGAPDAWVIAGVASPADHPDGHAVLARIEDHVISVVYDPSPLRERSGTEVLDVTYLVPVSMAGAYAREKDLVLMRSELHLHRAVEREQAKLLGVTDIAVDQAIRELKAKAARFDAINTPEFADFFKAVENEALHQRARWGIEGDAGKTPADWYWLLGYLGGKALTAANAGDREKSLHHIISSAAALKNWHAHALGVFTAMRPGIEAPAGEAT